MEEVRIDDYRIDIVDDFMLPNELVELRKDLNHFDWNAFETDIYKQQRVLSGMIADLPDKWRNMLDDRIVNQAKEIVDKEYSIFRGYLNAWKCDDVSLPHHDGNHTTCIIYCNRDYNVTYGGETIFYDNSEDVIGAVSPKPGRAVFFNGWMLHKAGSFNRLYQHDYRYTLAYKLTVDGDEEYAIKHGAELAESYGE